MNPMSHPHSDGGLSSGLQALARCFRMMALLTGLCLIWGGSHAAAPDYSDFDAVLLRNVQQGFVDYAGINADPAFARFLASLGDTRAEDLADSRRAPRIAHQCLQRLCDPGHPRRLHALHHGWDATATSNAAKYQLMGQPATLHDLETRQLMPLGDPRIHFAIVCASISCPRLCQPGLCAGQA